MEILKILLSIYIFWDHWFIPFQKYLHVLDDLDLLKHYYYSQYMNLLRRRVEKQHEQIKRRDAENESRHQQVTAPVKRRHEKHVLTTDRSYLNNVPKSQMYEVSPLKDNSSEKLNSTTDVW